MYFDTNVWVNVEVDWTYHSRSYSRIYVLASNRIATLMDADALFRGYAVVECWETSSEILDHFQGRDRKLSFNNDSELPFFAKLYDTAVQS